jgi:hypothetical protein
MRVFPELSSPTEMHVVLEGELQTGRDGWSQVYEGRLTIGNQTCVVVVKLYQECMFRDPSAVNFYGSEGIFEGDWPSGTEVAQREAWAYKQLQQYQGSTVPYSYGFYTVTCFPLFLAPSSDVDIQFTLREKIVVGFVMEKLSGLKIENFLMLNYHRRNAKMLLVQIIALSTSFAFINIYQSRQMPLLGLSINFTAQVLFIPILDVATFVFSPTMARIQST